MKTLRFVLRRWVEIVLLAVIIGVLLLLIAHRQQKQGLIQAYSTTHKCVRTGVTGRKATPVYICDTGYIVETEMADLAEEEELK